MSRRDGRSESISTRSAGKKCRCGKSVSRKALEDPPDDPDGALALAEDDAEFDSVSVGLHRTSSENVNNIAPSGARLPSLIVLLFCLNEPEQWAESAAMTDSLVGMRCQSCSPAHTQGKSARFPIPLEFSRSARVRYLT
jgi:hypothetical protein